MANAKCKFSYFKIVLMTKFPFQRQAEPTPRVRTVNPLTVVIVVVT